jgi:c-di-AMP phosphodiesterase-like protein
VAAITFGIWRLFEARRDSRKFLEYIGGRLGAVKSDALTKFPLPVAVTDGEGNILWANALFRESVVNGTECYRKNVKDLAPGLDLEKVFAPGGCEVICREGSYSVCATTSQDMGEKLYAFYFIDRTNEKKVEKLSLRLEKPSQHRANQHREADQLDHQVGKAD